MITIALFGLGVLVNSCGEPSNLEESEIKISELTVAQIHEGFKAGNFNAEELVAEYLERIENYNGKINAITYVNPNALQQARALDAEFKKTGVLRALHGIPMIVKDNFNTGGMPTTAGSNALRDFKPEKNAFMVQKLVDAGAIILAKSNMAEWAFSPMHTESSTHGTTRNPYNLDHVPAGSSGGTAAAIASNIGVLGLGTDTGNSIRGPSSHNALVGIRSTLGLTSRSGIVPLFLRNDVAGPMCRTVEDATRVLQVIAGYDPLDTLTERSEGKVEQDYLKYLQADGLKGARIGVLTELSESDPDPEVKALFDEAVTDLKGMGAKVVAKVEVPDFDELKKDQWCDVFREDVESYFKTYVSAGSPATLEDVIKIGSKSDFALEGLNESAKSEERNGTETCGDPYTDKKRVKFREAIEKRMDELKLDAVIYPTWNNKPALIEKFKEGYKGDNNQVVAPHTGQPAITVPMGYTKGNLPAGLQFLGRMYSEPTLIRLAYSYEQNTKHRKPPELN
ncbi:MAG: amidase [Pyrinomonadaceae bacterium]|nr:amidase [Pyrinomonadaceae bacterium]